MCEYTLALIRNRPAIGLTLSSYAGYYNDQVSQTFSVPKLFRYFRQIFECANVLQIFECANIRQTTLQKGSFI